MRSRLSAPAAEMIGIVLERGESLRIVYIVWFTLHLRFKMLLVLRTWYAVVESIEESLPTPPTQSDITNLDRNISMFIL